MRTFTHQDRQRQKPALVRHETSTLAPRGPADVIRRLQRTIGNQAVERVLHAYPGNLEHASTRTDTPHLGQDFTPVQAKLTISSPDDLYEQEANRTAERLMRSEASVDQDDGGSRLADEKTLVQTCSCGGGCSGCQAVPSNHEQVRVQRKSLHPHGVGLTDVPPTVHDVVRGMVLQRAPNPSKPAAPQVKVPERASAFRRGLTRDQELREIADKLIEKELGARPTRLGARRNGLAEIARRGGPPAQTAKRLGEALSEIEADLERRAQDVASMADDLIEGQLARSPADPRHGLGPGKPKTPDARRAALRNLGERGGEVGETATALRRELEEIEAELITRQPRKASQFVGIAEKTAGKVEEAATKTGVKSEAVASQALVKVEETALKAEAKFGSRLVSGAGRLGLSMLLPGPEDAILLMVQFAGTYGEAHDAIRSRNTREGFAIGLAAFLLNRSHRAVLEHFTRHFAVRDLQTEVVGAVGIAEKAHNAGLDAGFNYGKLLSDDAADALRQVGFSALLRRGELPEAYQELLTREGVRRLGVALLPAVDQIFEAMEAKAEQQQEEELRKAKRESGCVGMKC